MLCRVKKFFRHKGRPRKRYSTLGTFLSARFFFNPKVWSSRWIPDSIFASTAMSLSSFDIHGWQYCILASTRSSGSNAVEHGRPWLSLQPQSKETEVVLELSLDTAGMIDSTTSVTGQNWLSSSDSCSSSWSEEEMRKDEYTDSKHDNKKLGVSYRLPRGILIWEIESMDFTSLA